MRRPLAFAPREEDDYCCLLLPRLGIHDRNAALAIGRAAVEGAVAFGEMRRRREAAGERHIDHRHVGLKQQRARLLQSKLEVIALGRAVEITAEQALELASRQARL